MEISLENLYVDTGALRVKGSWPLQLLLLWVWPKRHTQWGGYGAEVGG